MCPFKTINSQKRNSFMHSKAIELHPLKPLYFCKRALALCYLNLNTEAIQDCTKALIIDPEFSKAYGVLGMAHYNFKNWHEAVKAFSKAVHLDRENTDFQSRLKWARERLFESLMAKSPTSGHQRTDMFNFGNMEQYIAEAGRIMAMADSGRRKLSPILPKWLQEHEPRYGDKFRTHKSHNSTTSEADPNRRERGDGGSRGTQ
ncbi:Small glutamine-rich tetratricopeptide repeat-containing protein alpha-like Protein [Tribolium castaneum]|uniref:Small glutamine-rich tetratricopeptide repeat-containing protein alpha-like Protein n=1 Tax=Tribolium castaneum TaxID=7070 RepID=A0A139WAE5_TRICA|nr:Small glutamine-rich tetratricopeptide repeat-containing protein alpha-like Protein [Tribolium castaneum]